MRSMGGEYRSRIVENVIDEYINSGCAPTIRGPAMCGLSATVSRYSDNPPSVLTDDSVVPDITMRTMSLYESGESNGLISLSGLFAGENYDGIESEIDEKVLYKAMVRGGWPSALDSGRSGAKDARKFLEGIGDLSLLTPIAPYVDTTTSFSQVIRDMEKPISRLTADNRLDILKSIMAVENVPSWELGVRPGDRLIMSDKWFFTDPSLVAALLGLTPSTLRTRRADLSRVFANLCVRDVRVYLTVIGGNVYHYYTRTRFDAGFVIELDDGRWASFTPCTDASQIDDIARRMLAISKVDSDRGPPAFSMIVVPTGKSYTRPDGIKVMPISCLRE